MQIPAYARSSRAPLGGDDVAHASPTIVFVEPESPTSSHCAVHYLATPELEHHEQPRLGPSGISPSEPIANDAHAIRIEQSSRTDRRRVQGVLEHVAERAAQPVGE